MKKRSALFILISTLFVVVICSCGKDHSGSNTANFPKYQKRWNIADSLSYRPALTTSTRKGSFLHGIPFAHKPTDTQSNYAALEFMLGSYVIFFTNGTVQAGQYTATNDTTLVLDSVGTIRITGITDATFSFTLTPVDGAPPVAFHASSAKPTGDFSSPADVAFITTTWTLDSMKFYIPIIDSSDYFFDTTVKVTYAIFSEYGTYLTRSVHTDRHEDYQTNTWLWSNTANSQFCYGNWDGQNITSCIDSQSVKILSYPSPYTKLVIQETDLSKPLCYYLSKH
jgi:hypothetical protein